MEVQDGDRRGNVIGAGIAMITLSLLSVGIRMATRIWIVLGTGLDDYLIVVALIMANMSTISSIIATKYGLGRHVVCQSSSMVKPYNQCLLVTSPSYSAAAAFIKLSLLAFYLRLSKEDRFRQCIYVMVVITITFGTASIFVVALQCIPLSYLWDKTQPQNCVKLQDFYYANAALNIVTDFTIYALPLPMLWKLHLPIFQRVGLCFVLSMGALVVFASFYRISTLRLLVSSDDFTWNITTPVIWSAIELHIAIFASCMPAFKACSFHFFPHLLGSFTRNTNSLSQYNSKNTPRRHLFPLNTLPSHASTDVRPDINTTVVVRERLV
ncbi:hypothetical protein BJ878DRAFT_503157 [Calycina marina]|uniref:Rhodopsin domain-containing protein n=1 Tax=Calycina marina TaxID=1763456 RepID=A0A9P7Z4D7_9HELO|nr:hypothetical protein BJ878DRAFT_503157 [Calycina marina]